MLFLVSFLERKEMYTFNAQAASWGWSLKQGTADLWR